MHERAWFSRLRTVLRRNHENRTVRPAHDIFGDAAQCPPLNTGAAVRGQNDRGDVFAIGEFNDFNRRRLRAPEHIRLAVHARKKFLGVPKQPRARVLLCLIEQALRIEQRQAEFKLNACGQQILKHANENDLRPVSPIARCQLLGVRKRDPGIIGKIGGNEDTLHEGPRGICSSSLGSIVQNSADRKELRSQSDHAKRRI